MVSLEEIRDNQPRPLEVPELGTVIMVRDITDGERSDISLEVEKERKRKIAERYAEFRKDNMSDKELMSLETDAINAWAMGETTKRVILRMVVEPDLSSPETWKTIPRRKLDAITIAVAEMIAEEHKNIALMKEEIKKS